MSPIKSFILLLLACALGACSDEPADNGPGQPVAKRRAIFKEFTRTLEPMGMVARERTPYKRQEFLASALALQDLAQRPWPLFAPGTDYAPSHAKAAVWEKPAEFKLAREQFQTRANELARLARGDDLEAIRAAVNEVQRSCKSCHNDFRRDS
jgi:cytochrome c556